MPRMPRRTKDKISSNPNTGTGTNTNTNTITNSNTNTRANSTNTRANTSTSNRNNPNRTKNKNNYHPPSVPRKARGGIKAHSSEGGEFGKNWWAKRWLLAMERLMDGARLQRGRRYARMGQVLSMNESNGGLVARVQGSRPAPYKVTIRLEPLSDEQWEKVLDVLVERAIFSAQLLAGEMPANIEEIFSAAEVSLFPTRGGDLLTECSCPDWANPCKHIAATHYILGDRFDEDPFLLFRMRGRSQEQILQALRQRRAGQEEPEEEQPHPQEEPHPLEEGMLNFWGMGHSIDNFAVNVQAPMIPLPLLQRLGEPDFARQHPLQTILKPAYEAISQAALIVAFSDLNRDSSENGSETP
jgi:uncharacterized Zn finger protein